MLKIDKQTNNIQLTRGDSMTLDVGLYTLVPPVPPATEPTREPYVVQPGDSIRFALSKGYVGEPGYELYIEKAIPNDSLRFTVLAEESKRLDYREYNYDIEITHADETVDTFISAKIKITGEAK